MKAAGITRVNGDVVVDDRLFTPRTYPDGLISPIWVNENLIDIEVTPGSAAGQAATIAWRPMTASYTVETEGLVAEVTTATGLGVSKDQVFPFDGAGSDDQSRVTPTALATFYKDATGAPYGTALADSLPILGKDGTLANVLTDSPAAGKIRMKTGNRVAGTPADQIVVLGNSLAGYVEAKSGRKLTIMVGVSNVPIATPAEFEQVTADQARMAAIQQAF